MVEALNENQQSQTQTIENHTIILNSHSQIINTLQSPHYDSVDAFENFATECANEPLYYYGGQAKINCGTKGSNGPFEYVYTRVTPGTFFSGVIRLYLSNLPEDCTSANIKFYINGVYTTEYHNLITDKEYQIELSFAFFALTASNVFRIQFSDINFRETIWDFTEIITENGRNFICLNRLDYFKLSSFLTSSGSQRLVYKSQLSNVGKFRADSSINANPTISTVLKLYGSTSNIIRSDLKTVAGLGGFSSSVRQISIATENNTLYHTTTTLNSYTKLIDGVNFAFLGYHWRNSTYCICGTLLNQQVFIGDSSVNATDIPTINSVALPSQFITCTPVEDWGILFRTAYKEIGYILLHNSGKIFFLPEDDATYFIEIGLGNQPTAYIQMDYETIYVYYHLNNTVYRKELKLNIETNKWELTKNVKVYTGTFEILEAYNNWQIHTSYRETQACLLKNFKLFSLFNLLFISLNVVDFKYYNINALLIY